MKESQRTQRVHVGVGWNIMQPTQVGHIRRDALKVRQWVLVKVPMRYFCKKYSSYIWLSEHGENRAREKNVGVSRT